MAHATPVCVQVVLGRRQVSAAREWGRHAGRRRYSTPAEIAGRLVSFQYRCMMAHRANKHWRRWSLLNKIIQTELGRSFRRGRLQHHLSVGRHHPPTTPGFQSVDELDLACCSLSDWQVIQRSTLPHRACSTFTLGRTNTSYPTRNLTFWYGLANAFNSAWVEADKAAQRLEVSSKALNGAVSA